MQIGIDVRLARWRKGARTATNGRGVPSVAVFSDGAGGWEIRDGNVSTPDAYVMTPDGGTTFVIDSAETSGLALSVVAGQPEIQYP